MLILNKGKYSAVQDKNSGFDMLACKNQVFLPGCDSNRVTAPYNEQNSCAAAKEHGNRAGFANVWSAEYIKIHRRDVMK